MLSNADAISGINLSLLIVAIGILLAYKSAAVVYDVFFSPLSAIPGPWYAAASEFYILVAAARFLQCDTLHSLFERYGPIVRIGPRRVVFCNRDAMKSVYCVNKLQKSTFYKALVADNHDHSMTMQVEAEHTARRKTYATHYALSHVLKFRADIADCVIGLVEVLDTSPHTSVDCIHVIRHLLVDIVRITVLGVRPIAISNLASRTKEPICEAARDFPMRAVVHSICPSIIWTALAYIPYTRWQDFYNADNTLALFVRKCVQEVEIEARADQDPLLLRLLAHRSPDSIDGLSDQDIVSECMAHLIAGVGTSAPTFGFMLWELSRRPDVVKRLRDELDEVIPDRRTMPDYATLAKQRFLSAFLNEGFRLYGAVSALLERVVPLRPNHPSESFDILGFQVPPGTTVGTQAWSMHRNLDIFPYPDIFDPERWLPCEGAPNDGERLARMAQNLMHFGAGTRACPGRYQAQLVFQVTIAALVLNFDLSADATETNEITMAPRDAFVVQPASRECKLTFTPRP